MKVKLELSGKDILDLVKEKYGVTYHDLDLRYYNDETNPDEPKVQFTITVNYDEPTVDMNGYNELIISPKKNI